MKGNQQMNVKKRPIALFMAVISILAFVLGGCTIKSPGGDGTVVRIEKKFEAGQLFYLEEELCTTAEARIFLMNQKNLYSERYGEEIWNAVYDGNPLYTYLEENLRDFMIRLKCMVLMAAANNVSLTADDERLIALATNEYYKSLSEEALAYCNVTRQDINDAYSDYFLANKLFRVLTRDATKEISLDEARVITVQMIYIPFNKIIEDTETESTETAAESTADESTTADTESSEPAGEPEDTALALITDLHKQVTQGGADFYNLAETYSKGTWIEDQICRGQTEAVFEAAAFGLSSGAISKVVIGKDGYYIIKCINNHEKELTDLHREELINEWKQDIFKEKYDAFVTGIYLRFNDPEWITLDFAAPVPDDNDSFYSIYNEFLSGSE